MPRKTTQPKDQVALAKVKKSPGRQKGEQFDYLSEWQREYMYQVWSVEPNLNHVSRVCGVDSRTVGRYRERYKWEQRRAAELEGLTAEIMLDEEAKEKGLQFAEKQAISQLKVIRGKALEAIMTTQFKNPKDAWRCYLDALQEELSLRGRTQKSEVTVLVLAAQRFQEMQKRDPKDITDKAEVKDGD